MTESPGIHNFLLLQEAKASVRLDGETISLESPSPQGTPMDTQIHSAVVAVTPELARAWLDTNDVNRTLRPGRVEQYARAMTSGRWTITNDDICLSPEGRLINGQHRLHAVIRAGVPVEMGVKYNVPEASMVHMDRGAGRTTSDVLRLSGEANTPLLAAILRQAWLFETGRFDEPHNVPVNDDELLDILRRHPDVRDSARVALRWRLDCPPTPVAFAHWMLAQVNGHEVADMYIEALHTRANEPATSAVHAVANRMTEARRARTRPGTNEYVYLILKGWNYWATGRPVSKLMLTPRGESFLPKIAEWAGPRG